LKSADGTRYLKSERPTLCSSLLPSMTLQPDVPTSGDLIFELPAEALPGAHLIAAAAPFGFGPLDSQLRIRLGLDAAGGRATNGGNPKRLRVAQAMNVEATATSDTDRAYSRSRRLSLWGLLVALPLSLWVAIGDNWVTYVKKNHEDILDAPAAPPSHSKAAAGDSKPWRPSRPSRRARSREHDAGAHARLRHAWGCGGRRAIEPMSRVAVEQGRPALVASADVLPGSTLPYSCHGGLSRASRAGGAVPL